MHTEFILTIYHVLLYMLADMSPHSKSNYVNHIFYDLLRISYNEKSRSIDSTRQSLHRDFQIHVFLYVLRICAYGHSLN